MRFGPPQSPRPSADERELLLGFIRYQREQVVAAADGLDEDQLRWTPDGALVPILGAINHLTKMEWRWVVGRYGGSPFPARTDEWVVGADTTGAEVIAAYAGQAEQTESLVRAAPGLEVPCLGDEGGRGPAHELLGFDAPVDLRWVLLHVLEETAHHAGHVDATRELLDGTRGPS
jgi:hypothetical protein